MENQYEFLFDEPPCWKKTDMSVLDKDEQFTQFFIRYQDSPFCVE